MNPPFVDPIRFKGVITSEFLNKIVAEVEKKLDATSSRLGVFVPEYRAFILGAED